MKSSVALLVVNGTAIDLRCRQAAVQRHFRGLSYPELKLAMRHMREMMEEIDVDEAHEQMRAFNREHPELTILF